MKELREILNVATRILTEGRPVAVATVVKIGGSSYRRPGARMLVDVGGQGWGTISGGCLEAEVVEQARTVLEDGIPRLIPFDLADDDLVLGFGTGCDGIVHVLIEPVAPGPEEGVIDLLTHCLEGRHLGVMATVTDVPVGLERMPGVLIGSHLLVTEDHETKGRIPDESIRSAAEAAARELLEAEEDHADPYRWHGVRLDHEAGTVEILLEALRPPVRLLIFGEGHDVHAVVGAGKTMGWETVVIGRKTSEALADRFPSADDHIFLMHAEEVLAHIVPDAFSAALVMNHTYLRDRELMTVLLDSTLPYVGMLGPKERTKRMLDELDRLGKDLTQAQLGRLYGPVGLDIGTETPEEIALAASAEIQAVLHHRDGRSLRDRDEPIHSARAEMIRVS